MEETIEVKEPETGSNAPHCSDSFEQFILECLKACENYEPAMSLRVCKDGQFVELNLGCDRGNTYSQWLPGTRGDCGVIRDMETDEIVGVTLPLINEKLAIFHDGPLRINEGFRKPE